jgi:hypothetical protein
LKSFLTLHLQIPRKQKPPEFPLAAFEYFEIAWTTESVLPTDPETR